MIAKLEWTQSNAQQNIEELQSPTMGVTINNEPTTTEPLGLARYISQCASTTLRFHFSLIIV